MTPPKVQNNELKLSKTLNFNVQGKFCNTAKNKNDDLINYSRGIAYHKKWK